MYENDSYFSNGVGTKSAMHKRLCDFTLCMNERWVRRNRSISANSRLHARDTYLLLHIILLTLMTEPSLRPSMFLSSAKLSRVLPSSCREKQVRWQVSSLSISNWWISCTSSILDTCTICSVTASSFGYSTHLTKMRWLFKILLKKIEYIQNLLLFLYIK